MAKEYLDLGSFFFFINGLRTFVRLKSVNINVIANIQWIILIYHVI